MKRTSALLVALLAACTLAGCASTPSRSSSSVSTDRRAGDSLGYAIFGTPGGSSRIARVDRDR